jgi:hypothetical protein
VQALPTWEALYQPLLAEMLVLVFWVAHWLALSWPVLLVAQLAAAWVQDSVHCLVCFKE